VRAVVLGSYGGPEVLSLEDVDDPVPGPDEVLVAVAATALNRADLLQRVGLYPDPRRTKPEIPGLEFSGSVAAVGARVTMWRPGDRVMGIEAGGGYAERIVTHERQLLAVPAAVALADAAAIPDVFLTAWDALVVQGGLTSGRVALVHAGASGVGTAAIQVAAALRARVFVTCSAGKREACEALGADEAIDYRSEDFPTVVKDLTGGAGVDVVLDVVGGDHLAANVDALRPGGRIVQVGVMAGLVATFPLGALLPKRASIIGTVLRGRPLEEKIALTQRFEREVLPLLADGTMRPVIDSRYPLDDIAAAHERMASNANVGKIVLDVRAS